MNAEGSDLLTVAEVAGKLRVAASTVRRWINAGQLEGIQFGAHRWGPVRIPAASLEDALRRWAKKAPRTDAPRPDPRPVSAASPSPKPQPKPTPPPSVAGWD
jgi:excisionase family DNA binding protein